MHPAQLPVELLLRDCDEQRTRRGGPGGQHRNKTETAIVLTHRPTGVSGQASERRSLAENRRVAVYRLRLNLALAIRLPAPALRVLADVWRSRSRNQRIGVAVDHDDFPAVLAEAIDFLQADNVEPARAARRLGVSTSQLLKLLRSEPAAWTWLARQRTERSLPPLK
jgi:RF-1 domain